MKKVLVVALSAILAVSMFTACGSKKSETANGTVNEDKLIMGTNAEFPPYEYYGDDGEVTGIDVEIAQAIADKLDLKLQVEDMNFDSIITAVQSGKADVGIAGMTVTEDRLKNVNFTDSYATGVQVVIVKEFVAANEGLKILDTEYVTEDYAIAIKKGNDKLTEKINGALKELKDEGKVQEILDKYINAE